MRRRCVQAQGGVVAADGAAIPLGVLCPGWSSVDALRSVRLMFGASKGWIDSNDCLTLRGPLRVRPTRTASAVEAIPKKQEGRLRPPPLPATRATCLRQHIALTEVGWWLRTGSRACPRWGKVKRAHQPRMGDESTHWVHRCLNRRVEGLDAAEPQTPHRRVPREQSLAAGSALENGT